MIILKQKKCSLVDNVTKSYKNIAYVECYIKLADGVMCKVTVNNGDKKLFNYFAKNNGFIVGEVAQLDSVEDKFMTI